MKNGISILTLVIILSLGCKEYLNPEGSRSQLSPAITPVTINYSGNVDFRYAAKVVTSSVVNIKNTLNQVEVEPGEDFFHLPDPFKDFFRDHPFLQHDFEVPNTPRQIPRQATGSGVILTADGFIVSNSHVVKDAKELEITLYDRRKFKGEVKGIDQQTDLALIKIDAKNLNFLKFGDSDSVEVGEWVIAVGNPFNLASTVTAGIVSAKARNINIMQDQGAIESFIQTDAVVNPGNSGGALVNLKGELIGINTAIATPTGVYAGYAFAIPSGIVKKVVSDLKSYGEVQRGVLGIIIRNLDSDLAEKFDVGQTTGVIIDSLISQGAAEEAGLKPNDVIVSIDGHEISSAPELQELIARKTPGDKIVIDVIRSGRPIKRTAVLKNAATLKKDVSENHEELFGHLGIKLAELTAIDRDRYQVDGGVKVVEIKHGILKDETDLKVGFVITSVNRSLIHSISDFANLLGSLHGGVMLEGKYPNDPRVYYYAFGID